MNSGLEFGLKDGFSEDDNPNEALEKALAAENPYENMEANPYQNPAEDVSNQSYLDQLGKAVKEKGSEKLINKYKEDIKDMEEELSSLSFAKHLSKEAIETEGLGEAVETAKQRSDELEVKIKDLEREIDTLNSESKDIEAASADTLDSFEDQLDDEAKKALYGDGDNDFV